MQYRRDYDELTTRRKREYPDTWDASELDPRFIPYFESGDRIKVRTMGGEITGTVGVTTGWRPVFLLIRTSRSMGSSITLGPKDEILAVQKGRAYVYGAA